jgi:hypothetical protein
MHINYDLTLDNGVVVSHHEATEVRFEIGTNAIYVSVDSWVNSTARAEERPPVTSRTLPLMVNTEDVMPMLEASGGNIALAVYNALLAVHFENGELVV